MLEATFSPHTDVFLFLGSLHDYCRRAGVKTFALLGKLFSAGREQTRGGCLVGK